MAFDNRQIQTAVLDRPDSYEPVVCPTELDELLAFREEYAGHKFFCGKYLNGCGSELSTRKGESRVCHFFHVPHPDRPLCGRDRHERSAGVASADHLYVVKATRPWLRRQGHEPKYRFTEHDDTAPPGSLIDISGEGLNLRFHSDRGMPLDWGGDEGPELVLGPSVRVDDATLRRRGYVNRFMIRSDGRTRVLLFCTVFPDSGGSEWYPVDRCEITPQGRLKTPALVGFVPPARQADDAAHHASAETEVGDPIRIGELVRYLAEGKRAGEVKVVRGLVQIAEDEKALCEGLASEKLQAAVTQARDWLKERDNHRRLVFRRLRDAVDSGTGKAVDTWLKQAREIVAPGEAPTQEEAALLAEADPVWNLWRSSPPQPGSRTRLPAQWWILPDPVQQHAPALPTAGPAKSAKTGPDTREAKRTRREARIRITALLARLESETSAMATTEFDTILNDLERAEAAAGSISTRQRRHIARWTVERSKAEQASGPVPVRADTKSHRPHAVPAEQQPSDKLDSAAAAVRGALKKAAREGETTSWSRLRTQLGSALPRMAPAERLDVLIRADQATPADQPLLSALAAAGDPDIASRYRSVAAAHGRETPIDDNELRAVVTSEVRRLHEQWRYR